MFTKYECANGQPRPVRREKNGNVRTRAYRTRSAPVGLVAALGGLFAASNLTEAATHYVDLKNPNPTPPYTSWATAATVIQDAVDAATAGDEVIVTDGIYATGGRPVGTNLLVNRVAVDKPLTLRSVNGPQFTVIQGCQVPVTTNDGGAVRCVYVARGDEHRWPARHDCLYRYQPRRCRPIFLSHRRGKLRTPKHVCKDIPRASLRRQKLILMVRNI